jgi:DNA-directed RNA polymerase subunit RPC12/RpoP
MATMAPTCAKCGTEMDDGFTLDDTYGGHTQAKWVEGPPVRSIWVGIKLKGKKGLPITTYRCPKCGFLESYAHAEA